MHILKSYSAMMLLALVLFALNVFVLAPAVAENSGAPTAQAVYMITRVVLIVALSFSLTKFAGKRRAQVFASVGLLAFLDQVVFKGILLFQDIRANPAAWQGVTDAAVVVNLMMGFMVFLPIILLLAMVGSVLTELRSDLRRGKNP